MLRIIGGDLSSVAYNRIKEEIRKLTDGGEKVFLLVPEQQAVLVEKELMRELPPSASTSFEVTNFTRLADTVYRSLGGLAGEYSTKAKESLIMWKTLTELAPFLNITGSDTRVTAPKDAASIPGRITEKTTSPITAGLVQKSLGAVAEMKSLGVTSEMLMDMAESPELKANERLSAKLSDIAKIMSLYTDNLIHDYTSVRDVCEKLAMKLNKNPDFFSGVHFYVSGFTSFTEPQYEVLKELMRSATVSVHLPMAKHQRDLFEFTEIRKTEQKLLKTADLAGAEKHPCQFTEKRMGRNPLLDEACEQIWRNSTTSGNHGLADVGDAIRIFEAQDPYEECDYVAADIKRRIMAGDHFRDFAIIARDSKKYVGLIDTSLSNAGIPCFISRRQDVSSYEAIKLIYAALGVVLGGFKREDVISYAKCDLSGIDAEACDEFELYTEIWDISGARFTDDNVWNMNPNGLEKMTEEGAKRLKIINEARKTLTDPLIRLQDSLVSAVTVRDHATALVKLLIDISLEEKLYLRADEFQKMGETESSDACRRLWGIICQALDDLDAILGDMNVTTEVFINQLKVVLAEVDIGKIPSFHDSVTVGSADMIRLTEKKHVYLIGVNAGEFPGNVNTDTYFTDKERQLLSLMEEKIDGDTSIPFARELFFFSRAMWVANESVTVTYSTRNESLGRCAPSDAVERLVKLMNSAKTDEKSFTKPKKIIDLPLEERIYFPSAALEHSKRDDVRSALIESGHNDQVILTDSSIDNAGCKLTEQAVSEIYPESEIALSQTKIESYIDCPFAYYLNYNLFLSENRKASFDARNIGSFIHAILETFFKNAKTELKDLKDSGKRDAACDLNEYVSGLDKEARKNMVVSAAKSYLATIEDGETTKRRDVLLDRLVRATIPVIDGICDELSDCKFIPTFFELPIDGKNKALPDPVVFTGKNGNGAYIKGSIDRVDVYKPEDSNNVYVRVIDYKTGQKNFSPSDINEGRNLQMFLYLKAIVDTANDEFIKELAEDTNVNIIPAGVIYVKTDLSDAKITRPDPEEEVKAIAAKQSRSGMILDDRESMDAMNKNYVPVKFNKPKKDGDPPPLSDSSKDKVFTLEKWDEMGEIMAEKIGEITDRMRSGDISLADAHGGKHCDSCKFKPICRKN